MPNAPSEFTLNYIAGRFSSRRYVEPNPGRRDRQAYLAELRTERGFNILRWTVIPRGGHFAAMEQPDLLAQDIREFFCPLR